MTVRRQLVLFGVLIAACALAIAWTRQRARAAASTLTAATVSLNETRRRAVEIDRLRGQAAQVAEHKRPEQDLVARVMDVMSAAGIAPGRHFEEVQPVSDRALPGSNASAAAYMEQSVRVTLINLAPAQVGAFLAEWSASQPLWTPTRIELTRHRTAHTDHARAADLDRYDMTLVLTATYISTRGPTR